MKRTPTGYKVLAGSEISPIEIENFSAPLKKLRHSDKIANGKLLEDMEFPSANMAGEFVVGNYVIAKEAWRTRDGVPLKNFLQGGN